jgi:phosphate transport system protein
LADVTTSKTHTDREYEAELREVREQLLRMAGLIEQMIADAARAIGQGDVELAQRTIAVDEQVDRLEVDTDELCLLMLARRQPLASDLRMITLAMKMVTDLERIGDLAVNICERAVALRGEPRPAVADKLERIAELSQAMIREAIEAFVNADAERARRIFARDDNVDTLYREIADDVQHTMHDEPDFVQRGVHLAAVAKFFERIADHGTNLAELVIFMVEGKDVRHAPRRT